MATDFPKVNDIAPADQTAWYRSYWLKVFGCLLVGALAGLYWVIKWAVMAALMELAIK